MTRSGPPTRFESTIRLAAAQPVALVGDQRLDDVRAGAVVEVVGEAGGVDDRLGRPVRTHRVHRVGGVTEQRDAAMTPAPDRVAVAHRVLVDRVGRGDQSGQVDEATVEAGEVRGDLLAATRL